MARTTNPNALDRHIQDIVTRAAREIAAAVRRNIADEVTALLGSGGSTVDAQASRKRRIITCPVPGCGKPGGGPKWGWFCADHRDLPAAEKEKARAATRGKTPVKAGRAKKSR